MTTKTFAVTAPDYSTTFGEDCKDSGHWRPTIFQLHLAIQEHAMRVANGDKGAVVTGKPVIAERAGQDKSLRAFTFRKAI